MRHPTGLAGLAFATGNETITLTMRPVGYPVATVPEFRRDAVVDHVAQHVGPPAVLDQPERIPAELKIVAPLIDAVGAVAFDVDPALHLRKELIEGRPARLQTDIGDAHDRDSPPAIGTIRPTRAGFANFRRDFPIGAVTNEESLTHNVPFLAGHAVIIIPGGR